MLPIPCHACFFFYYYLAGILKKMKKEGTITKKILRFLVSPQLMGGLFLALAFSMAVATFIESSRGTATARALVYGSWWFEILWLLTAVNLAGNMILYRTWKRTFSVFLFHIAFLFILAGAAITRYISYEGTMHIREGKTSDRIVLEGMMLRGMLKKGDEQKTFSWPLKENNSRFSGKVFFGGKIYSIRFYRKMPNILIFLADDGERQKKLIFYEEGPYSHRPATARFGEVSLTVSYEKNMLELPFSLYLKDFQLERYPGSQSPSSYASEVVLIDERENIKMPYRIYMNHTLKYKGYKFFQSSYDPDERGTILSVNHDKAGTTITYLGYLLMTLGMVLAIFHKKSRFMLLARRTGVSGTKAAAALLVLLTAGMTQTLSAATGGTSPAGKATTVSPAMAADFETVLVQDHGGRIKPFYSLASEVMRKVARKEKYKGFSPVQVVLGMYFNPREWQRERMIRVSGELLPQLLGIPEKYAAYEDFFDPSSHFEYKLKKYVQEAYRKKPADRSKLDQDVMKLDERLNVCYMVYSGRFFRFFPVRDDPDHHWYTPAEVSGHFSREDSVFVSNILRQWYAAATATGQEARAAEILKSLKKFQVANGGEIIPSPAKVKMEVFYMKTDIFSKLASWYGLIGFILVIILFVRIVRQTPAACRATAGFFWLLMTGFLGHTAGLAIRWYVSGHAPWSNGYESMIYIAWAGMLAGLVFVRKSPFALAAAAILSALTLFVAHLSWMNPEITNLVPVLKSYWLTLHVSIITASYGFLGLGMIIGLLNLLLYIMKTEKNRVHIGRQQEVLSQVNEMALILGLYFLTVGTFLGGVWANESWGRYWGWDPKETWALITVVVYAFVVHMRFIPGLRGYFAFNVASVLAFFSVIMTYFGVNYYLTGLHSYAGGDTMPVPPLVFWLLGGLAALIALAWWKEKRVEGLKS